MSLKYCGPSTPGLSVQRHDVGPDVLLVKLWTMPCLIKTVSPGVTSIFAVNPPGRGAGQSINRLVPAIMVVRYGHARVRLQRHLEYVDAAGGVVLALQESQPERAEVDDFRHGTLLLSANAA